LGASGEAELIGPRGIQAAFALHSRCQPDVTVSVVERWGLYAAVTWNEFLHPFDARFYYGDKRHSLCLEFCLAASGLDGKL
jgi:hypothetical protein